MPDPQGRWARSRRKGGVNGRAEAQPREVRNQIQKTKYFNRYKVI